MIDRLINFLPISINKDIRIVGLAAAIQYVLDIFESCLERCYVLDVDALPENVLDFIAFELVVEGYEYAETVDQKKQFIQTAEQIRKRRGTPWVIEKLFEILRLYPDYDEWFEYDGEPYHQRLAFDLDGLDDERYAKLNKLAERNKNVRSVFDIVLRLKNTFHTAIAAQSTDNVTVYPEIIETLSTQIDLKFSSNCVQTDRSVVYPPIPVKLTAEVTYELDPKTVAPDIDYHHPIHESECIRLYPEIFDAVATKMDIEFGATLVTSEKMLVYPEIPEFLSVSTVPMEAISNIQVEYVTINGGL